MSTEDSIIQEPESTHKKDSIEVLLQPKVVVKSSEIIDVEDSSSDSQGEEDSDENFLPFKKYSGMTSRKKNQLRYKHKLKNMKPNLYEKSDEELKFWSDDYTLNWSEDIERIITEKVMPEWIDILQQKKQQELFNNVSSATKQRVDAVWKKILRDARKFYRLLFNYYKADKLKAKSVPVKDNQSSDERIIGTVSSFFQEMGLSPFENTKFKQLCFYFIGDRHYKNKLLKANGGNKLNVEKSLPTEIEEGIFKNFSERKLKSYINDSLFAVLLNTLFLKYNEAYKKQMHPKARKKICFCVNILLQKSN